MPRTRKKPAPKDFESESITSESSDTESQQSSMKRTRKKRVNYTHSSDNYEGDGEQTPSVKLPPKRRGRKMVRSSAQLFVEQFLSDEKEIVPTMKTTKKQIDSSPPEKRILRSTVKKGQGVLKKAANMERLAFDSESQEDLQTVLSAPPSNVSEDYNLPSEGVRTSATPDRKSVKGGRKFSTKWLEVEINDDDVPLPVKESNLSEISTITQEKERIGRKSYRRSTTNKRKVTSDFQPQSHMLEADGCGYSEDHCEGTTAVAPKLGKQLNRVRKSSDRRLTYEAEATETGTLTKRFTYEVEADTSLPQETLSNSDKRHTYELKGDEGSLTKSKRRTCTSMFAVSDKKRDSTTSYRMRTQDKSFERGQSIMLPPSLDPFYTETEESSLSSGGRQTFEVEDSKFYTSRSNQNLSEESHKKKRKSSQYKNAELTSPLPVSVLSEGVDIVTGDSEIPSGGDRRLTYDLEGDEFSNQAPEKCNNTRLTYELDVGDLFTRMQEEDSNIKILTEKIEDGGSCANISASERSRKSILNKSLPITRDTKLHRRSISYTLIPRNTDKNKRRMTVASTSGDGHRASLSCSGNKRMITKTSMLSNKPVRSTYVLPKSKSEKKSLIPRKSVTSETGSSFPCNKENVPSAVSKRRLTYELDDTVNDVRILQNSTANLFENDVVLVSSGSDTSVFDSPKVMKNTSVYTISDSSCEDNKDSDVSARPSLRKIALFNYNTAKRIKPTHVHCKTSSQVVDSSPTRSPFLVQQNSSVDKRIGQKMLLTSGMLSSPLHFGYNKKPADSVASSRITPSLGENYPVPVDIKFGHTMVSASRKAPSPIHGRCPKNVSDAVASTSRSSPCLFQPKPRVGNIQSSRTRIPPRVASSTSSKLPNVVYGASKESSRLSKLGFKVSNTSVKIQSQKDEAKAAANKQRMPKTTVDDKRNMLKGVRTNRRFELLMKMRKK